MPKTKNKRNLKKRYQLQPWYIRLYRRLRYQPAAISYFLLWVFLWIIDGAPGMPPICACGMCKLASRWETIKFAWLLIGNSWTAKARWYYTIEEALAGIKDGTEK